MSYPVHVRPLGAVDLQAVLGLTHLVPEAPWWSEAHVQEIVAVQPADSDTHFRRGWVALQTEDRPQNAIDGFVVIHALRLAGSLECEIESIVVHPGMRERGVGSQLLAAAIFWCRVQGASVLRLEVRSQNVLAIRLYLRAGFVATGTRPRYYESPQDDALLLEMRF